MIAKHIPDALRPAFDHAIQCNDKKLLNLIELRLINQLPITPADAKDYQSWRAVGIAQFGRDLVFLWEEKDCIECSQCGGSGELEAIGRRHTINVECPDCDGTGKIEPEIGYNRLYTDIDGATMTLTNIHDNAFDIPNGITDELTMFLRVVEQAEKPAEKSE